MKLHLMKDFLSKPHHLTRCSKMKVIGIDPGTVVTGYACIEITAPSRAIKLLDLGIIRPPKSPRLSLRYHTIYESILTLLDRFKPDAVAIETPFIQKNAQSALKLGGAMGSILIAAEKHKISAFGYAPREVKKGVFGTGTASKEEIQRYLSLFLRLDQSALTKLDATDALAIAIHHLQEVTKAMTRRISKTTKTDETLSHPNLL